MKSLIPRPLALDCSFSTESWVPKTIDEFLAQVSSIGSVPRKILKLDDYITRLQEEMKKIDAFKRELPLCMLLLYDAIAAMKEELEKLNSEPKLEEFIPLKKIGADNEKDDEIGDCNEKDMINGMDKMNWMSSVQLWSSDNQNQLPMATLDASKKRKRWVMEDLFPSGNARAKRFTNLQAMMIGGGVADLSLHTPPEIKDAKSSSSRLGDVHQSDLKSLTTRKQRRCWSPELHRSFVNALQHLGGAQAATPKQIRELMRVDGLTNDEVKSHLQKYRLHSRRVPQQSNSQSGSPQGPLHLAGGDTDDDNKSESQSWKSHIHLFGKDDA